MQDEEVKKRPNTDYAPSLFALLSGFIERDNKLIGEFYKKDDRAVYFYRFYCKGDFSYCEDFKHAFPDFETVDKAVKEDFDLEILQIQYKKQSLLNPQKFITLETDKSGNVIFVDGNIDFDGDIRDKDEFFEGLWIDVPTPFKRGDIVCSKKTPFGQNMFSDSQPFVLLSLANLSAKEAEERGEKVKDKDWKDNHLNYLRENGDITDMTACGYFLSSDYYDRFTGEFYSEVMHDYTDLEYYRGEFKGGERVLLPIHYFLTDDIGEDTLVQACAIIKKEEEIKDEIRSLNLPDEWIEKIGLKKK